MSSLSSAINALSPAGYWKLDETSGTSASDSGPNGLTGTYTGAYTLGGTALNAAPDAGERSISVAGAGHVSVANSSYIVTNSAFSVFCLCNRNASTSGTLWHKGNTSVGSNQGVFLTATAAGAIDINYFSGSWRAVSTGATLPGGLNSSVTFIYLGGTSIVTVVNGVDYSATLPVALPTSNQPLYIGTQWQGSRANPFYGSLDEVAWFGTNITIDQAKELHAAALTPTVLIYSGSTLDAVGAATFSSVFSLSGQTSFVPETAERDFNILSSSALVAVTDQRDFQLTSGSTFDARYGFAFDIGSGTTPQLDARGLVYSSFGISEGAVLLGDITAIANSTFSSWRSLSLFVPERGYITRGSISFVSKSTVSFVGEAVAAASFLSSPQSSLAFKWTDLNQSVFGITSGSSLDGYGARGLSSQFSLSGISTPEFSGLATVIASHDIGAGTTTSFYSSFSSVTLLQIPDDVDVVFAKPKQNQVYAFS